MQATWENRKNSIHKKMLAVKFLFLTHWLLLTSSETNFWIFQIFFNNFPFFSKITMKFEKKSQLDSRMQWFKSIKLESFWVWAQNQQNFQGKEKNASKICHNSNEISVNLLHVSLEIAKQREGLERLVLCQFIFKTCFCLPFSFEEIPSSSRIHKHHVR